MNRTDAFANDFCRRMQETENGDYEWKAGGHPLGKGHECVDIVGRSPRKGHKLVLVEVELRKDAPLTNVVKVWRWVSEEKFETPFVLIQAFSRYYKKGDTKRSNAEFVGKRMRLATNNSYLSLSFKYNPYRHGKQGAGRRCHHARLLANQVRRRLKKLL
jgi:hypothetical protein